MMATLENSTAERNCQTLGGCREKSYSLTHPDLHCQPRPQGPPCAAHPELLGEVTNGVNEIQSKAQ